MGGVETHCEQLFPRLKQLRPSDSITVIARRGYLPRKDFEYMGLRIIALTHASDRRLETITNAFYGVFYARFVLHAELLHLQGIGVALVIPFAKALGMKVITTYHSKNYEHRKWSLIARTMLRAGELFAVRFGDRVISVSRCAERDLKRRFPRAAHKIWFIPNGASRPYPTDARLTDQVLRKYGLTKHRYIVSVGRLVPEKGLHDLIRAFELSDLDCKLVIVGEADHPDDYSRRLRSHASNAIVFTGFLHREVVDILLRHASLFVLPSYNEGLPIAALEAITAGAQCLLSNIEPNRDLGLSPDNYFKVGDVRDLRLKLGRDHSNYHVDRDAILERFDWNFVCAETDKLYASVLTESQRHRHRVAGFIQWLLVRASRSSAAANRDHSL
jgi:glycosyltransferase involved in cell wall biosynthesis